MAGRITLITGASAGIGCELARIFARAGKRVALVARRAERLQALADEIVAAGGESPIVIACDLRNPDACAIIRASSPPATSARLIWSSQTLTPASLSALRLALTSVDVVVLIVANLR